MTFINKISTRLIVQYLFSVMSASGVLIESAFSQQSNVAFTVNMNNQIKIKNFFPERKDKIVVRGSFNNWKGTDYELKDADKDGIYSGQFQISSTLIEYKYVILPGDERPTANDGWEQIENRKLTLRRTQLNESKSYFNNLNEVYPFKVSLKVDMSNQIVQGNFIPKLKDKVVVRGNFNSWYGNEYVLLETKEKDIYSIELSGHSPSKQLEYKFAVVSAKNTDLMNEGWEAVPNRTISMENQFEELPVAYFSNQQSVVIFRTRIPKNSKYYPYSNNVKNKIAIKMTLNNSSEIAGPMSLDSNSRDVYKLVLHLENAKNKLTYSYCILQDSVAEIIIESKKRSLIPTERGTMLPIVEFDK